MERKYRIRKGLFGKCILQELRSYPSIMAGSVDSSMRIYKWEDLEYNKAHYSEYYPDREKDHI